MKKVLSILTVFAAITSFSTPVLADTELDTSIIEAARNPSPPDWNDRYPPEWNRRGGMMCRARNILGQSFNARGDWRTPQQWVANRALTACRQRSLPFIARTCQLVGCRRVSGGDNDGGRDMIRIRSAIYGANCTRRPGNETNDVARFCNGRANCSYTVDAARIGDPAYGCRKDFRVQYVCRGRLAQAYLAPEANGKTLRLRCGF